MCYNLHQDGRFGRCVPFLTVDEIKGHISRNGRAQKAKTDIPSGCDIRVRHRMAMEIILNRHDETPWGFRMTGGKEFQSPFFVVKVGRGSIAEKSGLYVGDMVYAINHEYADQYTHADAQRVILHTGKTLILNIRRGELRPGYSTPMPDFSDAIMAIEAPPPPTPPPIPSPPPPYEPPPKKPGLGDMDFLQNWEEVEGFIKTEPPKVETPPPEPLSPETPEGELEQDAFFSIKIKRSGRISAIEELEGPSRSPSTGRSRSPSRERKKSLTKSSRSGSVHKCQETEEYSSMSERNETLTTESSEIISSSIKSSVSQEQKSSSQAKKTIGDLTDDDITDMLTGEAQVLIEEKGTIGINFNKLIPKVNFIKDSSVLKALEEQQFRKEEPEEVQLAREPTKRFSTFLQKPARPVPQPKFESQVINDDLPWKKRLVSESVQQIVKKEAVTNESSSRRASVQNDSRKQSIQNEAHELSIQLEEIIEKEVTVEEESTMVQHTSIEQTEVVEEEVEGLGIVVGQIEITDDMVEIQVDDGDDEKKSVHFEDEVQKQSRSESISTVQSLMLEGFTRKDIKSFKKEEVYEESKKVVSGRRQSKDEFEEQLAQIQEKLSAIQKLPEEIQLHVNSVQEQLTKIVEMKCAEDEVSEEISEYEQEDEVKESVDNEDIPEGSPTLNEADTNVEDENIDEQKESEDRQQQQTESRQIQEDIPQEPEGPEYLEAPPSSRGPHTPQPRPIVLPGGRKWRKPKDAFNDQFIAETIIGQSEVLVGSTIGVNFCKYIPAKFDGANSAVCRLIHEIEDKSKQKKVERGIEGRPEKVMAEEDYQPPISERHFFAAKLAERLEIDHP